MWASKTSVDYGDGTLSDQFFSSHNVIWLGKQKFFLKNLKTDRNNIFPTESIFDFFKFLANFFT